MSPVVTLIVAGDPLSEGRLQPRYRPLVIRAPRYVAIATMMIIAPVATFLPYGLQCCPDTDSDSRPVNTVSL